jgi:rubrerythrin
VVDRVRKQIMKTQRTKRVETTCQVCNHTWFSSAKKDFVKCPNCDAWVGSGQKSVMYWRGERVER